MALIEPIRIDGLARLSRNLRKIDGDLPKALRVGLNGAASIVVDAASADVPRRSGRAARSIQARSTRTLARVTGGGRRAPYLPWLDYGGSVGKNRSVQRQFIKSGRYIYPAYRSNKSRIEKALGGALESVIRQAGVVVD